MYIYSYLLSHSDIQIGHLCSTESKSCKTQAQPKQYRVDNDCDSHEKASDEDIK